MEMRQVLFEFFQNEMMIDDEIIIIDADLSKSNGTYKLRERFPDRAIDVGVAEQNMAGIAAGLAAYGFKPFISTFSPFATRRILDQITVSIAYANNNVKIIGTDPGISAELNGGTHMSFEDIGSLRSIPNMVILEPIDAVQLKQALPEVLSYQGPMYIRLFRKRAPEVFNSSDYKFNLFRGDILRLGGDITIIASGILVNEAMIAASTLEEGGIDAEVISIHTIKPIDKEIIVNSAQKTGKVITCENHNTTGGLRSSVAEVLSEYYPVPIKSIGIKDNFGEVGTIPYLKERFNLTAKDIVNESVAIINDLYAKEVEW